MTLLSIDDLITSLSSDEVKASWYQIADSLGLNTTQWQRLSPLRTVAAIISTLFAGFTSTQATVNRSGWLDFARGDWLTLRAKDVYGVERNLATFAKDSVTIGNAAGGSYSYGPGDLVVLNTTKGKSYANTSPVTIAPLQTGVLVEVQALEAGSGSTAEIGQIDAFVSASPQLSVTNTTRIVGVDAEEDADLVIRCRESLGLLSPGGAAAAFRYVAKSRNLNGDVDITRAIVLPALGNGTIRVVVASSAGVVPGTTGDPTTDLGKVFLALNTLATPAGYTLLLSSATVHPFAVSADLYVATSSGLLSSDAVNKATTALQAYVNAIPIGGLDLGSGGKVLYRALENSMENAAPGILQATLALEADIALAATEVAALSGAPVITAHQVNA